MGLHPEVLLGVVAEGIGLPVVAWWGLPAVFGMVLRLSVQYFAVLVVAAFPAVALPVVRLGVGFVPSLGDLTVRKDHLG